jgi:hypothetical protein
MLAKSKITLTFGTLVIAAITLTFATAPMIGNQKAFAANLCGSGLGSPSTCSGIPQYSGSYFGCYDCYPYYGGYGGYHFHHFHGGFGFHHFHGGFGFHHVGGHHFR